MKNTIKWLGIIVLVTIIGFSMISCDPELEEEYEFEGKWTGTISGPTPAGFPATLDVSSNTATLNCSALTISNMHLTYIRTGNIATLRYEGQTVGNATVTGNAMAVVMTAGDMSGQTGAFTRIIENPITSNLAPTITAVTAQSSTALNITWTAPSTGGTPLFYNIYRSTSETGTYNEVGWKSGSVLTHIDTAGLSASTTYWYKVEAEYFGAVKSPQSAPVSGTTN